jgi:hypothetical protein
MLRDTDISHDALIPIPTTNVRFLSTDQTGGLTDERTKLFPDTVSVKVSPTARPDDGNVVPDAIVGYDLFGSYFIMRF